MMEWKELVVIDTNVLVMANRKAAQASFSCFEACKAFLEECQNSKTVVLDDTRYILREYARHCSHRGSPGFGDAFFKWLFERQAMPEFCKKVVITPTEFNGDYPSNFHEFPSDPALATFDKSDRKFVAVAIAHRTATEPAPPIYNAVDSDWKHHKEAFERVGITVRFLCDLLIQPRL